MSPRFLARWTMMAAVTLLYFAMGKLGLALAFVNPSTTAIWPPTGIALAACLLLGAQVWPAILVGAFLVNITTSGSGLASLVMAVGNTCEGLLGAYLVNRCAHGRRVFEQTQDSFKFVVLAGLLSPIVSATFGTTSLVLNRLAAWPDYAPIWLTWWLGDAGGALVVAPVVILWAMHPRLHWRRAQLWEAVALLLSLVLLGFAVFGGILQASINNYPLGFLIVPLIVWVAFRFGQRETATAMLIWAGMATWGTLHGFGPFARLRAHEALLVLQAFMGTLTVTGLVLAAVVSERQRVEMTLREVNEQLRHGVNTLAQRNREMAWLNEMGALLQSCRTVEDAYAVIARFAPQLFPGEAGALYILSTLQNLVEATVMWGAWGAAASATNRVFAPNDCWALRRRQWHLVATPDPNVLCPHLTAAAPLASLCLPLIAQRELLGMLHVHSTGAGHLTEAKQQLAQTMADSAALALANIRLRESLRQQSIRDPLTGLFNRRYFEESLDRELRRATRNDTQVGLVLLDIDHFKHFNDTFGHEAGDLLLRELGSFLKGHIRGGDIACRYGGEEFVLVLPDTSLQTMQQRATQIHAEVKHVRALYQGRSLGPITLSLGVVAFPQHGQTREGLLRVADDTLYRAKHEGRNRVVIAD
jgi:diguanylate cyclase (GGDEF)-like protein